MNRGAILQAVQNPGKTYKSQMLDLYRDDCEALRSEGLSYNAISGALRHFRAVDFNGEAVRYGFVRWGEPLRESMIRSRTLR